MSGSVINGGVFRDNFASLSSELEANGDITRGQLNELAITAVRSLMSQSQNADDFKEAFVNGEKLFEAFASVMKSGEAAVRGELLVQYCVSCAAVYERCANKSAVTVDFLGQSEIYEGDGTVACIQNQRSTDAIEAFREKVGDIEGEPVYAASFSAVCEEVYDGAVKYGVIPVLSSDEGVLGSFYRLIDKYDLKIAATTEISHGDSSTRFALVRRGFDVRGSVSVMELSVYLSESTQLSDFLFAVEAFGAKVRRVNAYPLTYDTRSFTYSMCLDTDGAELVPLLLYLNMTVPDRIITGLYNE